ncbi:coiled-coil domain-containing protein [Asanoa iriomotensis]|uniref:ARB-07466-like C-terminal domain-containing protein n=1 Tax=Asanoa iriomotensis TaxID=234613 RepID=A0ABQ4CFB7_9ACTN|nr:hypothetical protein [Asanoa iriomotensis]GIF61471.1 hypothetical protein Air01nite_75660 [Asanoa iriomotensis]
MIDPPSHPHLKRRWIRVAAVMLLGLVIGLAGPMAPANADPDDEGGTAELRDQLDKASRGYLDAQSALKRSQGKQQEQEASLRTIEQDLVTRVEAVAELGRAAYRTGRLSPMSALINSDSPDRFLERANALGMVAANEQRAIRGLEDTKAKEASATEAIKTEVREQQRQVALMKARKDQAERALDVAAKQQKAAAAAAARSGGSGSDTGGSGGATATPAKRNSDGSWPTESCSVDDPTPANGCITPRTLHALQQAKAAGFTHYVSCYRSGGSGEHPKGRACDFAAAKGGFEGDATGADKTYGTNLANYFIRNSDQLAVLYVIWYRQIWLPSSGWKAYSGAGGDPSSDHTNHVHLSVY